MATTTHSLENLTDYTVDYYKRIKTKYGKGRERHTEIREFDNIEATKVVVANAKLYVDREGGFFGIGNSMKKDEYVCDCSDIDDVIVFDTEGNYIITKVTEKAFYHPNIYYIGVFKRNDERTIYNVLYRDGKEGPIMMKRCAIKGVTRDKEYTIGKGTPKSKILHMSVNPNGEAEVLKIMFKQRARLKKSIVDLDFSNLAIKGRAAGGNLFSRYAIHKITVKEKGVSTLAGQNIWFDEDIQKLNAEGRGRLLGEFAGDDKIVVFTAKEYYLTGYDVGHHFPEDTIRVEKYDNDAVYTAAYYDGAQKFYYLKRFPVELSDKMQPFIEEDSPKTKLVAMSADAYPQLEVVYGGAHKNRPADVIDAEQFIGVKSHRARGKRISTFDISKLRFVEPLDKGPKPIEKEVEESEPAEVVEAVVAEKVVAPEVIAEKPAVAEVVAVPEPKPTVVEPVSVPVTKPEPATPTAPKAEPTLIIERPEEEDDTRNPDDKQLNLF